MGTDRRDGRVAGGEEIFVLFVANFSNLRRGCGLLPQCRKTLRPDAAATSAQPIRLAAKRRKIIADYGELVCAPIGAMEVWP